MRRWVPLAIAGTELAVLAYWALNLQFPTGFDSLQYQRMASSIARYGLSPWIISPWSYLGMYPGSDSSGVPFLTATASITSATPVVFTVVLYDALLLLIFGFGMFLLVSRLTRRLAVALLSSSIGSLAFGFFSALSWSLDERSFNVALAPVFLLLIWPNGLSGLSRNRRANLFVLGMVSLVMLVSHLSFLLLLPFLVLPSMILAVVRHRLVPRRQPRFPLFYFAAIALLPLILISTLNVLGILTSYGLEYQLENSALFSGSSPLIFFLNSFVFLATRIGPVNATLAVAGFVYLASRRYLRSHDIIIGSFLVAGFLGLPVVLYSKDLLTPILVLLAGIGIANLLHYDKPGKAWTLALAATVALSGSVAFNAWNAARTSRAADSLYWALPGVTQQAEAGNLWINTADSRGGCAFGNNPALLQQVVTGGTISVCNGVGVDYLIGSGTSAVTGSLKIHVIFAGFSGDNPGNWFASPFLEHVASDFSSLPFLSYEAGRAMLLRYNVSVIVVDLRKPTQIVGFNFENSYEAPFFVGLWTNAFPVYRSADIAVFGIG